MLEACLLSKLKLSKPQPLPGLPWLGLKRKGAGNENPLQHTAAWMFFPYLPYRWVPL